MLFVLVFQGLCGWNDTSKGAYDWNRDRGGTPSSNTGPSADHTLGNQHYFFVRYQLFTKSTILQAVFV